MLAGNKFDQVAPVGADVRKCAGLPALTGIYAPVTVGGSEQPILQIGAVDELECAHSARLDAGLRLAHHGVVAVHIRHRGHPLMGLGQGLQLLGVGKFCSQGLFAHHMLAGTQCLCGHLVMQSIGGADMDYLHMGIRQQLGQRRIGLHTPRRGHRLRTRCAGAQHAAQHSTAGGNGPTVHVRNHSCANEGHTQLVHCFVSCRPWGLVNLQEVYVLEITFDILYYL